MHQKSKLLSDSAIRAKPPGVYADGECLWLHVSPNRCRRFVGHYWSRARRKERHLALGLYPGLSLAAARIKNAELLALARQGTDPTDFVREREQKQRQIVEQTFQVTAKACIDSRQGKWRGDGQRKRIEWETVLGHYAYPKIGRLPVAEVNIEHVLACLNPLWAEMPKTAERLRVMVKLILAYARSLGYRTAENCATTELIRPRQPATVTKALGMVRHHAAMPYARGPMFLWQVRQEDSLLAKACEFLVLIGGLRISEVLELPWPEIDLKRGLWTLPALRTKTEQPRTIPLPTQAVALLQALPGPRSGWVFPSDQSAAGCFVNKAMRQIIARHGDAAWTNHGFRTALTGYLDEESQTEHAVKRKLKGQSVGNAVDAAYSRTEWLAKQRIALQLWADFVSNYTPIQRRHIAAPARD